MNYYELLQVSENASEEVIKMAYKALMKKYHPDTFKGDKSFAEEMTKKINEAYDTLSDPIKRREYDSLLKQQRDEQSAKQATNTRTVKENTKPARKEAIKHNKLVLFLVLLIATTLAFIIIIANSAPKSENQNNIPANSSDSTLDYQDIGVTFTQYKLAKIVSYDPLTYCEYIVELDGLISNANYRIELQKEKATEYLNNLPLDYGERIILFRMQFPSDTTYCKDIVEYLDEREDVSYNDMIFVFEELGLAVFEDGTVKW